MNFSGFQHQHAHDPSQIQPYDQSIQPYYGYYGHYDQQYAYFPSHAHSISDTQQPNLQFQQEPTSIHPPGVPVTPEPANAAGLGLIQMQNQQLNPVSGAAVSSSSTPAAVAVVTGALAQFTQSAGNVDGMQRATHAPTGPSQYRVRGGRGSRPFRGGGWSQLNHQGPAPYRSRGRGLGGGRHFPSHSSGHAISNVAYAPAAAGATSVVQPSSSVSGHIPLPKPAQVPAAPLRPPPRKEWCEICKVECNTLEILEQHKNGKRHKKNLQVHEELQRHKAMSGQQSQLIPTSQWNLTVQREKVQDSQKKGCPTENMGSEATADNRKDEIELQNNVGETSEVPAEEPEGKPMDNSAVRGRGFKRKIRGGRGCKYRRTSDGSRRPVEPPKPKQAICFVCELCNVKCESQVVYDSHLTGKKHLSSLKRVHGHQTSYGEVGLQALNPVDNNALLNSINSQVQQGVSDPQVLLAQLLMTVLSQAQLRAIAPPSGPVAAQTPAPTSVAGSSYEPQFQNVSQTQGSEITAHVEIKNPIGETKNQLLSAPLELDAPAGSSITPTAGGSSETKEKVLKLPQDSSGMAPAETPGAANEVP